MFTDADHERPDQEPNRALKGMIGRIYTLPKSDIGEEESSVTKLSSWGAIRLGDVMETRVLVLLSGFQNVENTEPQRNERSSSGSESKVYELRHRIRK